MHFHFTLILIDFLFIYFYRVLVCSFLLHAAESAEEMNTETFDVVENRQKVNLCVS